MVRTALATFVTLAFAVLTALPAAAQDAIGPAPEKRHWITQLIALLLLVCTVVAAFQSSRRTHQD